MEKPQINASDVSHYARYSTDSTWEKFKNIFLVVVFYFYVPFLAVWYLLLRYVVTAYGSALTNGYALTEAWSKFFSNSPHETLSPEASAFMEKADAVALFPITSVGWILDNTIGAETLSFGLALMLGIGVFVLLFVALPFKLFQFFQRLMRNTLDKG